MDSPGGLTGHERGTVTAMLVIRGMCHTGSTTGTRRTNAVIRKVGRNPLPPVQVAGMTRPNGEG